MTQLLTEVPEVLLMGPGPSAVHPETYKAMSVSTLGHMDAQFIGIMDRTSEMLRSLMNTKNAVTFPVSGTGSAGMEAAFVNLVEPGDRVLVLINGVFGTRMSDVAGRLGAQVDTIEAEWGTPIDVARVKERLAEHRYKIVAVVHAETSTGVRNPVDEIGAVVGETDALYLVDGVTSLGGIPVKLDEWGVDAFYSGTQKCLSVPPGLAPASFSDRAVSVIENRTSKVPNWYLDVSMLSSYYQGQSKKRSYHHTAPINMIYGLLQGLALIEEEGYEAVYDRHRRAHERLVAGIEKLGLSMVVEPDYRLPNLNAVTVPEGVDEAAVRGALRSKHHIEIGAGLGPLAGKIWRVGIMGHTARETNVDRFLSALAEELGA
ncbi:MAG: pyridoxal-phosphate-dependent aminotransferase family protein [Spirochaetaceae bacterium]